MIVLTKDGVEPTLGMKVYQYLYKGESGETLPRDLTVTTLTNRHLGWDGFKDWIKHYYADKKLAVKEAIECWKDEKEYAKQQIAKYEAML